MTTTSSAPIVRLLWVTLFVAVTALGVSLFVLLRAPTRVAAPGAVELEALRQEVSELRRNIEITRSPTTVPGGFTELADVERRLSRLEARPAAATIQEPGTTPDAADAPTPADAAMPRRVVGPGGEVIEFDAAGRLVVPTP